MINKSTYENNKTNLHGENNDEEDIHKKYEKSRIIWSENKSKILEYDELFDIDKDKNKYFINENTYYLINKEWLLKFKKFSESLEPFFGFLFPGPINNNNIIIQDKSALNIKTDTRLYFNNNNDFDKNCIFIEKKLWEKLFELYGGGPEYKIIYSHDKHTNLIKEGGHINLLFLRNNIYDIKNLNNLNEFIITKHIYFNLNRKINNLREYLKKIINSNAEIFFKNKKGNLKENKDYRLWLYTSFYGSPEFISKFFSEQIINLNQNLNDENKDEDTNNYYINWKKFNKSNKYEFKIILLSNFEDNEIKDVFPNKYTNAFDWKDGYGNLQNKDNFCLPEFTIIIEQAPFRLMKDNLIYKIDKCSKCKYTEIVYYACECNNLFFCSKNCQKLYKGNHLAKCKIALINIFKEENKKNIDNKNLIKYSLKGLTNLGNTCYMNSALQCMRSIKELTIYFLNYFEESQLNKNNIIGTGGFLTLAYINFIYNMNNIENNRDYFTPSNFKNTIGIIDERYSDNNQQDTHEFMTFLIDSLHEDLNKVINKPSIERKDSESIYYTSNELLDDKKSIIEWNNFLKRNQSIMVDLFYGQYKTTILCPYCDHKSINFSIYLNLQLPIPKYNEKLLIKVVFNEEGANNSPPVKMNIILDKHNNKIFEAKKIIGKILDISPFEIEILSYKNKDICKVFENEEEINENIKYFNAVKINSRVNKENTLYNSNSVIDYSNLKEKIENKKTELIKIFENKNDINDDNNNDFNITIDINDNQNLFVNNIYEKCILKHYCLLEKEVSTELISKDNLIYIETNKTYYDIYYKIYDYYYEIIIEQYLDLKKQSQENYNDDEHKNKMFKMLFEDFIENKNTFTNTIFETYKNLPFILKLGNCNYNDNQYLPPSKKYIFKDLINDNNNNIQNNDINKEININNEVLDLDINKGYKMNDLNGWGIHNISNNEGMNCDDMEDKIGSFGDNNGFINGNNYDSLNNNNNFDDNLNNNNILINIQKDDNEDKENNYDEVKTNIKSIIIIWNTKFLKKKELNNGDYYLTKSLSSETIDLCSFFQKLYKEHFENILIEKCFEEFCREETFDKDNLWKCSKCHENSEAKNKIEIYQTPKILIIQLKRFKNNQKIEEFIDFPIKDLDINKFISSSSIKDNKVPKKYDLFAVVNHYGRLEYGHYDAFCLSYEDNCWYNFNDSIVSKIKKEEEIDNIITKDAYILFYRQQNNDLIDWEKVYKKKFIEINDKNMKTFDEDFIYKNDIFNNINRNEIYGLNWDKIFSENKSTFENTINSKENEDNFEESKSLDNLSLNSFVYNPFRSSYLKIKRHRFDKK